MVQLASQIKAGTTAQNGIIEEAFKEKANQIKKKSMDTAYCSKGQIRPWNSNYAVIFDKVVQQIGKDTSPSPISYDDLVLGYSMFSSMIHCPESKIQTYQFLHRLLLTQSPRTIIQATANTIQSEDINEDDIQKGLNKFYFALNRIFNFQFGKILLATASPPELQMMMAKDRPYISAYIEEIQQCLQKDSCQGVLDIINTLGQL